MYVYALYLHIYMCMRIYTDTYFKLHPGSNLGLNCGSNPAVGACSSSPRQRCPADGVYLQPLCPLIFRRSLQPPRKAISPRPLPIRRAARTSCLCQFFCPHTFPVPSFRWAPVTAVSFSLLSPAPSAPRRGAGGFIGGNTRARGDGLRTAAD